MAQHNGIPRFNLGAVIQQTGLSAHTLRVWESRYGLPQPQRSQGGHRLYSERDVATVQWLVERRSEGFSISKAVSLWQDLVAEGSDPLAGTPATTHPPAPLSGAQNVEQLRLEWITACLAYDQARAEQLFSQAIAYYTPEQAVLEILAPGVANIGERWYRGEVTVQQEHFASDLAARRLRSLIAAAPPPTRRERLLLALPHGETHDFSLLVMDFLLKRRGWDVISLGADVPFAELPSALEIIRPRLVLSLAQRLWTAARLQQFGHILDRMGIPLAYGGRIFVANPELRKCIPAHYIGDTLGDVPLAVERLISDTLLVQPISTVAVPPSPLWSRFRESQLLIEALVTRAMGHSMPQELSSMAVRTLSHALEAALAMDDLDLVAAELQWLDRFLVSRGDERSDIGELVASFALAIDQELGEEGSRLLAWLSQYNVERRPLRAAGR